MADDKASRLVFPPRLILSYLTIYKNKYGAEPNYMFSLKDQRTQFFCS